MIIMKKILTLLTIKLQTLKQQENQSKTVIIPLEEGQLMVEKTVVLIVHQPRKRKMPVPPPGAAEKEPQRCFISFIFNIYFIKPIQFLIFVIVSVALFRPAQASGLGKPGILGSRGDM